MWCYKKCANMCDSRIGGKRWLCDSDTSDIANVGIDMSTYLIHFYITYSKVIGCTFSTVRR